MVGEQEDAAVLLTEQVTFPHSPSSKAVGQVITMVWHTPPAKDYTFLLIMMSSLFFFLDK